MIDRILPDNRAAFRLAAMALWVCGGMLLAFVVAIPMELEQQVAFSVVLFLAALLLRRHKGRLGALVMMAMSLAVSCRYIGWRLTETMATGSALDLLLGLGLLFAELYAFVILLLGYLQAMWPLRRQPVPLPDDVDSWPSIDVFIPTYNEPLAVVRTTVLAATLMDWPRERLNIYLLDDGRREEFREFCEETGIHYLARNNNRHAKAGNINAALAKTNGDYVAIFDCDHIPTRSFLQMSMGWFLRDTELAVIQMPHYFFSPDPFERNLGTHGRVPNEGELFYGLLQDGNDQWNASFFCGSCAIIKRGPLLEVGGVATDTVTEDAHTALRLHRAGYRSAYLALPQAAGLATESLSAHVAQRVRWARGMAQVFRTDNPLTGPGLTLAQRLCYFNAMLHFFYGVPRLVFLTAPLAFLLFGAHVINASALMIVAYAIPHILHANVTNLRVQGRFRHLLWNEVYETTLAWYIVRPTLLALINPRLGKFNVTPKGGLVEKDYFDAGIAKPYVVLLLLNLVGVAAGIWRLLSGTGQGEAHTIWFNLAWTAYNLLLLGATIATAGEVRQVRRSHRVALDAPARLYVPGMEPLDCRTREFSTQGLGLQMARPLDAALGGPVEVGLMDRGVERRLPAILRRDTDTSVASLEFQSLTLEQERWLVATTFSRADVWLAHWGMHPPATIWSSFWHVLKASIRGFSTLNGHVLGSIRLPFRPRRESST